jgi:hypothetical protein
MCVVKKCKSSVTSLLTGIFQGPQADVCFFKLFVVLLVKSINYKFSICVCLKVMCKIPCL